MSERQQEKNVRETNRSIQNGQSREIDACAKKNKTNNNTVNEKKHEQHEPNQISRVNPGARGG